jgi:hypothetical protein
MVFMKVRGMGLARCLGRIGPKLLSSVAATVALGSVTSLASAQEQGRVPQAEPTQLRGVQLQREMQIELEVEQPNQTRLTVRQLVYRFGGTLAQESDLYIRVTIPAERWDDAISAVSRLGVELSRRGSAREKLDELVDLAAQLRALEQSAQRLTSIRRQARTTQEGLVLQQELSRIDQQMDSVRSRNRAIVAEVRQGSLVISLQLKRPPIAEEIQRVKLPIPWLDDLGIDSLKNFEHRERPARASERDERHGLSAPWEPMAEFLLHLTATRVSDSTKTGDCAGAGVFGLTLRGAAPSHLAFGGDMGVGAGSSGGLAYDNRFLLGVGTGVGKIFTVSLMSGLGLRGVTGGRVPGGLEIPVEAGLTVRLGEGLHMSVWGRPAFQPLSDEMKKGASLAPFGDTMRLGARLSIGRESAWFVGGYWEQLMGTDGIGLIFGYGLATSYR